MSGRHPSLRRLDGVSWTVGLAFWGLGVLSVLWFGRTAAILLFGVLVAVCWGAYCLWKAKGDHR